MSVNEAATPPVDGPAPIDGPAPVDGPAKRQVRLGLPAFVYRFLRILVHAINRTYWRVEVEGASVVPTSGPVILAPVHRSFMDFFVASEVTKRKIFYMAKDDLWNSGAPG